MEDSEFIIDLEGVSSDDEVQERIEETLPLPEYYGGNLDALYDALTESGDGWHVIIVNKDLADSFVQPYIEEMIEVFEDASAVAQDLWVDVEESEDED